jgi:hypothetical protein
VLLAFGATAVVCSRHWGWAASGTTRASAHPHNGPESAWLASEACSASQPTDPALPQGAHAAAGATGPLQGPGPAPGSGLRNPSAGKAQSPCEKPAWVAVAPWSLLWPEVPGDGGEPGAAFTRGPYLQQVGRNSARVVWHTSQRARCTLAWGPGETRSELLQGTTAAFRHVAPLAALRPAQRYSYEVRCAGHRTALGSFTTEGDRSQRFRVAVYGDTRTNHEVHRTLVQRMAADPPALAFHTGDLVGVGARDGEWDNFFQVAAPLLAHTPLYPALGNHEGSGHLFLEAFELPDNSPSPERYYSVRHGNALFLVLDLYGSPIEVGGAQAAWMEEQLAASLQTGIRHRIVLLHHGPYDSGSHGSNLQVRSELVPLFEHYGVDIVFSGHDHSYERGTVHGVKYVVTGGGGAPLHPVAGDFWTQVRASVHHHGELEIHGPRLTYTAWKLDGTVLDSFQLSRGEGECAAAEDCSRRAAEACEPETLGEWQCVLGACIRDCRSPD